MLELDKMREFPKCENFALIFLPWKRLGRQKKGEKSWSGCILAVNSALKSHYVLWRNINTKDNLTTVSWNSFINVLRARFHPFFLRFWLNLRPICISQKKGEKSWWRCVLTMNSALKHLSVIWENIAWEVSIITVSCNSFLVIPSLRFLPFFLPFFEVLLKKKTEKRGEIVVRMFTRGEFSSQASLRGYWQHCHTRCSNHSQSK